MRVWTCDFCGELIDENKDIHIQVFIHKNWRTTVQWDICQSPDCLHKISEMIVGEVSNE